ncbi:hypothetical protein HDU93_008243 [Gonapodya sp. JEL0774]|nr:hypothetical protein HDU93_008243 [Gonapodya sp. JEL0774]
MFKVFSRRKQESETSENLQQTPDPKTKHSSNQRRFEETTNSDNSPHSTANRREKPSYPSYADDRSALFSGATNDRGAYRERHERDPDSLRDLDVEEQNRRIQGWVRETKTETRDGSRRALERLYEIEGMASSSLETVVRQGERISRANGRLDSASSHATAAAAHARDLEILNRPFWMPVRARNYRPGMELDAPTDDVTTRAMAAVGVGETGEERRRREEKETVLRRARMEEMAGRGRAEAGVRSGLTKEGPLSGWSSATLTDADLDSETDRNLEAMGSVLGRLKLAGLAMNEELEVQNRTIDEARVKVEMTQGKVSTANGRLENVLRKR